MALHWHPVDSDPLAEFSSEREPARAPRKHVPPQGISLPPNPPVARLGGAISPLLVVVGFAVIGAALFLVFAAAR